MWTVLGLEVGGTIQISIVSMPMQVLVLDQYLVLSAKFSILGQYILHLVIDPIQCIITKICSITKIQSISSGTQRHIIVPLTFFASIKNSVTRSLFSRHF